MKKILLLLVAVLGLVGLTACGGGNTEDQKTPTGNTPQEETIKVWCAENIVDLTKTQLENFKKANPDVKATFVVEAVGEGDAASKVTQDVTAAADIYCFPQDQLARLVAAGALAEVTGSTKDTIKANNDGGSVGAASVGDKLYAYPLTSDNGYFMYYDKSVIQESSVGSLSALIADCEAANRKFSFELNNGWYVTSFFFATGCVTEWTTNSEGAFTSYKDTFNSAKGLVAVEGMKQLTKSSVWVNSSASSAFTGKDDKGNALENFVKSAVLVSGTWNYDAVKAELGDNMGVAKLPSFTVGSETYQLGSFGGFKLVGTKPQSSAVRSAYVQLVASYLTSETCQLERFNAVSWGPSNVNAQNSEAVKANPALVALAAQSAHAIPQGQFPDDWWKAAGAINQNIYNDVALQSVLDQYAAAIAALIS